MMKKKPETVEEIEMANEKSRRRQEVRQRILATKVVEKGLLIVHTGNGKGKSTAAFGMVLRSLGHGYKVGIIQFIKGGWHSGERTALEKFGDQVMIRCLGDGFTWETKNVEQDMQKAQEAWQVAKDMMKDPQFHLILLDELNIALRYELLSLSEVLTTLQARRPDLHMVITGRHAKPELMEAADLVTEMKIIKHPFRQQGVKAQAGIEF